MNRNGERLIVSVIIPVCNRADLVKKAIASVLAGAAHVPLEVIVGYDAFTDDTWQALQSMAAAHPALRLARLERNGGLELARRRFVEFLDSDDVLRPGHLAEGGPRSPAERTRRFQGYEEHANGSFATFEVPRAAPHPGPLP